MVVVRYGRYDMVDMIRFIFFTSWYDMIRYGSCSQWPVVNSLVPGGNRRPFQIFSNSSRTLLPPQNWWAQTKCESWILSDHPDNWKLSSLAIPPYHPFPSNGELLANVIQHVRRGAFRFSNLQDTWAADKLYSSIQLYLVLWQHLAANISLTFGSIWQHINKFDDG